MTRAWRLLRLLLHLLKGVLFAITLLPRLTVEQRAQLVRSWCAQVLGILCIRVVTRGELPDETTRKTLFVSNHISWIDIWALMQLHHIHFVAKSEIRAWPVIGWLATKTGTIFIERERRHDTGRVMGGVEQALLRGECLCLFPEGTTSDGNELKPFKSSLFQAAINADATVWPLAIRYPGPDGLPNTAVAYHGDVTMWQSLQEVLKQREVVVELHFAHAMQAQGMERRHLSHQARHAISSLLHPPPRKAPEKHDGLPVAAQ
jgi:1-acyl-sn-glycerol-3-phosphate acyltransferase